MTHTNLETQLTALEPAPDDELAARILLAAENRHRPVALPTHVFAQIAQPTQHTSCFASTLPLLTGIAGGLIGAAVMFLAVTFFVPPKVEIREVVRYVSAEPAVETQSDVQNDPITQPAETVPVDPPKVKPQPQPSREVPWVLAWLYPRVTWQTVAYNAPADLDAMLEYRSRLAKNAANFEPRPQLVRYERNSGPPSEFSPLMYREMIEKENSPAGTTFL